MIVRSASLAVVPEALILVQAIDRPRIRIVLVEVSDDLRHIRHCRKMSFSWAHDCCSFA
jgi:hypothetical protein